MVNNGPGVTIATAVIMAITLGIMALFGVGR
jgi:hypothetical protein